MGIGRATIIILCLKILRQLRREITRQQLSKQSKKQEIFKTRMKFDHKNRPMTLTSILVQNQKLVLRSCRQLPRLHTSHSISYVNPTSSPPLPETSHFSHPKPFASSSVSLLYPVSYILFSFDPLIIKQSSQIPSLFPKCFFFPPLQSETFLHSVYM